jgi:peptidase M23-like protein
MAASRTQDVMTGRFLRLVLPVTMWCSRDPRPRGQPSEPHGLSSRLWLGAEGAPRPSAHRALTSQACHFSVIAVRVGDSVKRGQRIGAIGASGQRALAGFEHVHLELQRGHDMKDIEELGAHLGRRGWS